jgi:hypothetical protein
MAVLTNTYKTYETKGIREDLSDMIYTISPEETPFVSNAGKGPACQQTFFEWQLDALASVDTANAQLEGDDISAFDLSNPTTRVGNYTQISRKTAIVSDTNQQVKSAGRKSEMAYQLSKKSSELKRDIEGILLASQAAVAGAAGTARKTGALLAWIRTNQNVGATGAAPSAPAPAPTTTRTDGTQRAFTEIILKDVAQQCWTSGAKIDSIMLGAVQKQVMAGFVGIATKTISQSAAKMAVIVGAVEIYVSDFGIYTLIPNRFQRNRDAFFLDWEFVAVSYLRPFNSIPLAKTGDAEKRLLRVEWGLRVLNEAALGIAADLT